MARAKKLFYSLPFILAFLYLTIPSRSVTLLPEKVMESSISIFKDIKQVHIGGYKVYNAGMLALDDGYLFVTRKSGETIIDAFWNRFILRKNVKGLLIGELDNNFCEKSFPKAVYKTEEFVDGRQVQYIDPRLFRMGNDIYMVYCRQISRKDKRLSEARLQLAKIEKTDGEWKVVSDKHIYFNDAEEFYAKGLVKRNFEKNWMPFSSEDELYFVYLMDPEHVVLKVDRETGEAVMHSRVQNSFEKDPNELRGSTPVVFDEELGEWLTLYHFVYPTVRNTGKKALAYFMGGYTFSKEYPYNILRKTKGALVGGELYNNYRKFVFPTSLIRDGDDYLIFYGDDDATNKVARIPRKELIESLDLVRNL